MLVLGFVRPGSPESHWPPSYESSTATTQTLDDESATVAESAEQQVPELPAYPSPMMQPVEEQLTEQQLNKAPPLLSIITGILFLEFWSARREHSSNGSSTASAGTSHSTDGTGQVPSQEESVTGGCRQQTWGGRERPPLMPGMYTSNRVLLVFLLLGVVALWRGMSQ